MMTNPDADAMDDRPGPQEEGRLAQAVLRVEEIVFAVLLVVLTVAGLLPILGRRIPALSVGWAEPLSRHLVLWIALFGAAAATRDRNHIAIDAVTHFLPVRGRRAVRAVTGVLSAVVCGAVGWLSLGFIRTEAQNAGSEVAFFGLHEWWLTWVLPLGFAWLTLRFLIVAWQDVVCVWKTKVTPPCS